MVVNTIVAYVYLVLYSVPDQSDCFKEMLTTLFTEWYIVHSCTLGLGIKVNI